MKKSIIFLQGPTASGKTSLALELVRHFPCEIISVDSAMVYRGMDIGTAKPSQDILREHPHHLINIADPLDSYSAGQFRRDALQAIENIIARQRIPLLVGGTMLYFSILQEGLAELPRKDENLRAMLQTRGEQEGWHSLHQELLQIDPDAAKRIKPADSQRIQRALEVFLVTGKTITAWQQENTQALTHYHIHSLALMPHDRLKLHQRIASRLQEMFLQGFISEVEALYSRSDLSINLPAIRSVGYRQIWEYLAGEITYSEMQYKAIAATRQLAKRQLTWLRSWKDLTCIDTDTDDVYTKVMKFMQSLQMDSLVQ